MKYIILLLFIYAAFSSKYLLKEVEYACVKKSLDQFIITNDIDNCIATGTYQLKNGEIGRQKAII